MSDNIYTYSEIKENLSILDPFTSKEYLLKTQLEMEEELMD